MTTLIIPTEEPIYKKTGAASVVFNQLGVKIQMDSVSDEAYFGWLDCATAQIGQIVPGAQIAEKENVRAQPTLNTAVYYDTSDYRILVTGALLRTSCNVITHAFCTFKDARDEHGVRQDNRHVFEGDEKRTIQQAPTSDEAVAIVRRLFTSNLPDNPAIILAERYGINGADLSPAIRIDNYRYTFYVWLDRRDALRCSLDRAKVTNLRSRGLKEGRFSEVELSIYPRIDPEVARDRRIVDLIEALANSLLQRFSNPITTRTKYQRAASVLGILD